MNEDNASTVSGRDALSAMTAIDNWITSLPHKIPPEQLQIESLRKEILAAIRLAKKQAVEACGFAYYEIKSSDHENSAVIMPILMDSRKVFVQFIDEDLTPAEMKQAVQKWREVLRARVAYEQSSGEQDAAEPNMF